MTILALKSLFQSELNSLYPTTEIESFYNILAEHKLGMTRIDRALQPQFSLSPEEITFFKEALHALSKATPVQHITGKTSFYGLPFIVNKNVLIPRPETEELVDWILEDIKKTAEIKIIDIGTGSGCIAISLAKNLPNATIWALDFSKTALETAKKNAHKNGVKIHFLQQDILATNKLLENFDIVVSNPPYIRALEKKEMNNNVLDYEPHSALFVEDNNALVFYKKITALAAQSLNKNGKLFFEINQYLGKETLEMLNANDFSKNELRQDIFGNDRMTKSSVES